LDAAAQTLALTVDTSGCTGGDILVEIYCPDIPMRDVTGNMYHVIDGRIISSGEVQLHRYAKISLREPPVSPPTFSSTVSHTTTSAVDNYTDVSVFTQIDINATVLERTQRTFTNTTTYTYVDQAHTQLGNTTSSGDTQWETTNSTVMLVLLSRPPVSARIRASFDVVVQLVTQDGLPIPNSLVGAVALGPVESNLKLTGTLRAFTDVNGTATLTMHFATGVSGNYTLLFAADAVVNKLREPNGLTHAITQRATKIQNNIIASSTRLVQAELNSQVATLQARVQQTVQAQVQATIQQQTQQASQQATQDATNCILQNGVTSVTNPNGASSATQACINNAIQVQVRAIAAHALCAPTIASCLPACFPPHSAHLWTAPHAGARFVSQSGVRQWQLAGLQTSVTQTLTTSLNDVLNPSGGGNFGIDQTTIVAQLQPLIQSAIVTAINQIPGLRALTDRTSLPRNASELLVVAEDVARAVWSLLPLPAPVEVFLVNGLDIDNGYSTNDPEWPYVHRKNGANFTAPLAGYSLSESSDNTNMLSGMSSCTLAGYARTEPSARGQSFFSYAGLLEPPTRTVPQYLHDADEAASYFSSALWQPFPFNNFNFLFDNPTAGASYDSRDVSQCKTSYISRGGSFPLYADPAFNIQGFLGNCPSAGFQCLLNVVRTHERRLDRASHCRACRLPAAHAALRCMLPA
jgi:hypothetical protein